MRAMCSLMGGLVLAAALAQPACARQEAPAARDAAELYRTGRYEDAIAALRGAADPPQRRLLARIYIETGRYADAEAAALGGAAPDAVPPALANVLGEALYAQGKREAAERAFARAAEAGAADAMRARLNRAVARWERGARAEALRDFDTFIDDYNAGRARTADELAAVATAVTYLGVTDPKLFHDAVKAYEEAMAADAGAAGPRLDAGELFLGKYSSTEASALFREVLALNPRHPRAWLGLARARAFDGSDEALAFVDSSLAVNPASPAARAFRAQLLLGLEDYDGAIAEAERALATNPASLQALAILGAAKYLSGDRAGHADARRRALALDPAYGQFDVTVAEMAVQHRRYREALELARQGLAVDSMSSSARALIGLTELRLGDAAGAQRTLQAAFAADPFNVWVKNTLDLLDTYPQYVTRSTSRFELFMHGREADVLELYMSPLAEDAYEKLSQRYGVRPQTPVRVEVYPNHGDFSVRTVGLAGLGALGVAFGNILALDSPSARDPGDFNWGSTLWHEIAHAVTLEASVHRVPRWLTEGISVLEERRAGWGSGPDLDYLMALKAGMLLPVSELNSGFVRPRYPQQIMHAYYQASLVAELIEQDHGERALRDMLRAYGAGRTTPQVFRDVLKTEPKAFDAKFEAWQQQKFARQLGAITVTRSGDPSAAMGSVDGPFMNALRAATRAFDNGQTAEARTAAEQARDLYPEYAAANGPHLLLYRIHLQGNDRRAAADALRGHLRHNESDYQAHLQLAGLLEELGDAAGAADVLERAMFIYPYEAAVHTKMAELYAAAGNHRKAVRERRAVLALEPVNRADALYRLAVALADAGQRDDARREVLRALEIAPNFPDAQDLLLRLRGGAS